MLDVKLPDLPELTFEEESHTYKVNGIIIPSVSTIMRPLSNAKYDGISSATLAKAAKKGGAVHDGIENWIKFGMMDVPEEHKGYFDGFLEWWNLRKPIVVGSEVRIYHKLLRYGGTGDLLCYIDGKLNLIDYKTTYTVSDMTCGVQLESYAQAFASHGVEVEEKRILHLKKDGKWSDDHQYPAKDPLRWRVFGGLKTVYDYIESNK